MNLLLGQDRWTVEVAIEEAVAADVITAALFTHFRSRQDPPLRRKDAVGRTFRFRRSS
jgi:6-phosphogluconate dehydrogenase